METLLTQLRRAASSVEDRALNQDLFDLIGDGSENAADTLGDVSDYEAPFSDIACSTIACSLAERDFAPRYGSDAKVVQDWFFTHGLSF